MYSIVLYRTWIQSTDECYPESQIFMDSMALYRAWIQSTEAYVTGMCSSVSNFPLKNCLHGILVSDTEYLEQHTLLSIT